MTGAFVIVVALIVATPGADTMLVIRNAVAAGRAAGVWTSLGVSSAAAVQGVLTSVGIGAIIVASQPVFLTLKWVGAAYLAWLGLRSLWAAWRGAPPADPTSGGSTAGRGFREGFLCNITNPKMFAFFLALLPQFVAASAPITSWLAHALMLPLIGTLWLVALAVAVASVRTYLLRNWVRRLLEACSGAVLLTFGLRLARS